MDFIEAGPGLLQPVLECIVENARSTKKGFSVGGYLNHIVESVIQKTWSITSLLKDQETRVKVLLHEHVSEGKLADEIKEQLLKFMNKYHMYITGIIAVSFYYILRTVYIARHCPRCFLGANIARGCRTVCVR